LRSYSAAHPFARRGNAPITYRRPTHLPPLIHARVDQTVHNRLSSRCRNPKTGPVSSTIVYKSYSIQRLLDDGHFSRLGGTQEMISEARIVSSSNADLEAVVKEGRFRSDLYFRLNVTELRIPPLRARREDIVSLAEHFIAQFSRAAAHRIPALTPSAMTELLDYGWPGNVRKLRHRVQSALDLAAAAPQLSAHTLFPEQSLLEEPGERVATLAEARERAERLHTEEAIRQTGGEIAKAATLLGISRTTLWEEMRKLHI
jgi:transcriptional regulator with PAS, ATPase and Fis domain